jgi:hypothetical protein
VTPLQREALRADVLRWVQSADFDAYFGELHVTPGTVGLLCLGCILRPGRITPAAVVRAVRNRRLGTGFLRRRYRRLAESGRVVLAGTWMVNSALAAGEVDCAPAMLIAGAEGTLQADNRAHGIMDRLSDLAEKRPGSADEKAIRAMLEDEDYHAFRVRRLPPAFTGEPPIFLFDTILHSSAMAGADGEAVPFVVCLVNPEMKPAILPVPTAMVARHIRS